MTNPEELFDLYDERGRPLGLTKARHLVHRDGDWHRCFHCWIVSPNPDAPSILLQRRSPTKDLWPGYWDVSVGGHYSAGEGIEGGLREISEEVGLDVRADELIAVARRREVTHVPTGILDREIQDIYFLRRDVTIEDLQLNPEEVTGLALVPLTTFQALATNRIASVTAPGIEVRTGKTVRCEAVSVEGNALVPRAGGYYARVARLGRQLALGTAMPHRWRRW